MEPQDYSAFADLLSKFHTASEPIRALMIVAVVAMVLGVVWLVMRGVAEIFRSRRCRSAGRLVLGVYQDPRGRFLLYREGAWNGSTGDATVLTGDVIRAFQRGTLARTGSKW
jgi:hypothetical protein